jgi:hypothetical protein
MQRNKAIFTVCAVAAIVGLSTGIVGKAAEENSSSGALATGTWQQRHASFTYYGITALYSCDGLEDNIRALFRYLGARKDVTVNARGCPRGSSVPGHNAIVDLEFYTLAPSSDTDATNSVQARWTPISVSPTAPYFMGHGDCELIDEMKDIISKNFSFRDLSYRTDCVPHQVNIDDFGIKAQALKPLAGAVAASR